MWVIAVLLLSLPPRIGVATDNGVPLTFATQEECVRALPDFAKVVAALKLPADVDLQCVEPKDLPFPLPGKKSPPAPRPEEKTEAADPLAKPLEGVPKDEQLQPPRMREAYQTVLAARPTA